MHIERKHSLGKEEAKRRIDRFVDDLMRSQFPGGVQVTEAQKNWAGDTMDFSFRAKRGFFGANIAGNIRVSDNNVAFDSKLPSIVETMVGEDRIRSVINDHLDDLLGT